MVDRLRQLEPDDMTPLDALNVLHSLHRELRAREGQAADPEKTQ